jgi:hypothetical protein
MKETDLAKPVAKWMRKNGYTVYAEVPFFYRCVDLVGVKDNNIMCIELKLSLTRHVIRQAVTIQLATDKAYVGVGTTPRKSSIDRCKKYGLGILSVKDDKVICMVDPVRKYDRSDTYVTNIIKRCKAIGPSDDAGKACQAGEGPAQDCLRRIQEYRKDHPKATWKEIYDNVPNQYSSAASMYGGMRMVRERRARAEYRKAKKQESEVRL